MRPKWSLMTAAAGVAALIVLCPLYAPAADVVTLKCASIWPASYEISLAAEQWCREIEKRTQGRVKISYYPGATLTPAVQTYDAVAKGIADIGMSALTYTQGRFPVMEVIDLPLGYRSGLQATRLANEVYRLFRPKEFEGVKVLYFHAHGPGMLHAKRPLTTLEGLRGVKIRSGGMSARVVQALGGAPAGMPVTETYAALKTGAADGVMAPMEAMGTRKLGEVLGYTIQNFASAYSTAFFVIMNKARWNSLAPDVQRVFDETGAEWIDKYGRAWDQMDRAGLEFMLKRGNRVVPLSAREDARWAAQMRPILDDYVRIMGAKGLPGDEVLRFCLNYLSGNVEEPISSAGAGARYTPSSRERRTSPDLVVSSIAFKEPSGNNMLDAGERGSIRVTVQNRGGGEAWGVRLKAEAVDPKGGPRPVRGLIFTRATSVGTLKPGEERTCAVELIASDDIPTGDAFLKAIAVEESGFDSQPVLISFRTRELIPPNLQVARVEILDVDGKRVISKGKEVTVTVTVQNAGGGAARGVSVGVESGSRDIALLAEQSVNVGALNPGEAKKVSFSVNVTRRYSGSHTLPLSFRIGEERPRFSVRPDIRLVLNEEAPDLKVVKVEAREIPPATAATNMEVVNLDSPPSLRKEQKAFGPHDVAVVIGIEQYRKTLPRSDYSYNDARAVKAYLEALGFAPRNIQYLKNDEATRSDIQKSIERWLPNRVKKESRVFIYYSGHGSPDPVTGSAYLVPYDGDPEYLHETGYSVTTLYERMAKLEAAEVMVVMDACFSGMGGRSVLARGARPLVAMIDAEALPQNTVVLTASRGGQISASSNEKEHGLLTYYFLKAIKDGKKSVADIYEYIRPLVEDEAKRQNVEQTPAISPSVDRLGGRFLLMK